MTTGSGHRSMQTPRLSESKNGCVSGTSDWHGMDCQDAIRDLAASTVDNHSRCLRLVRANTASAKSASMARPNFFESNHTGLSRHSESGLIA